MPVMADFFGHFSYPLSSLTEPPPTVRQCSPQVAANINWPPSTGKVEVPCGSIFPVLRGEFAIYRQSNIMSATPGKQGQAIAQLRSGLLLDLNAHVISVMLKKNIHMQV